MNTTSREELANTFGELVKFMDGTKDYSYTLIGQRKTKVAEITIMLTYLKDDRETVFNAKLRNQGELEVLYDVIVLNVSTR